MSKKEKSTILYSRNGIKIEKTEFIDLTKYYNNQNIGVLIKDKIDQSLKKSHNDIEIIPAKKAWTETKTRQSKLGFYYYEIIDHKAEPQKVINHNKYDYATYKKLSFKFDDKRYEMIYPIKCGEISIDRETRPWDLLPGTTGIEDHFIFDLYREVLKFFSVCEDQKICYGKDNSKGWINNVRKEVLRDLFGDENGPSVNYNDIKILSHGFDLKESFRKRKENK